MPTNLDAVFAALHETWSPVVIAELNGQQKAVPAGALPLAKHTGEGEFPVHKGRFRWSSGTTRSRSP
jgi:hypothetical protein